MPSKALAALTQPLAISERGLQALAAIAESPGISASAIEVTPSPKSAPGVAVVDINGPLSKDESFWQVIFGGSSYASIRRNLEDAVADSSVKYVVLNIDSPGGEVYGCAELAAAIDAATQVKPIVAYIAGQGDSAAYWLASAANEIVIASTAEAGSIGVRCMLVDDSKRLDAMGVKPYHIVASQSPHKVVDAADADDRARVQAQMTELAAVFIADVAKYRDVSISKVVRDFGRGDVLIGQSAVDAGLADRLGDFTGLLAELSAQTKGKNMAKQVSAAKDIEAAKSKMACGKCERTMSADDEMYCGKCFDGDMDDDDDVDGDEEGKKAFVAEILSLTGAKDMAGAIGVVTAMKNRASDADKYAAELVAFKAAAAEQAAAAEKAEIVALIDAAVADGRLAKSRKDEMHALAAKHGKDALTASLSFLSPLPPPAVEPNAAQVAAPEVVATNASHGFDAQQLAVFQKMGLAPDEISAHRERINNWLRTRRED